MSIWQFTAAMGGFAKSKGAGSDRLNREDADRLAARVIAARGGV